MKKLIKLVPMMALLLGLGVYTVNAKMKALEAENALTDQQWIYSPPGSADDPTNQDYYQHYSMGDLQEECEDGLEVCGVSAPSTNPSNPAAGKPDLTGLETDLEEGNPNANIFRGNFSR
ncbi:hypothetical protein [Sphingobacterium corticibacterium]|uniref:Uncharacterized protein n=1 Tax=Sphingobacterium corticibacterium TaxID=2484746 RepID=A0A4Q6XMX6_9SPHI|nr:hypothetical protein [Sphingobacterium corticibacterium]RZF61473.1 hypothetical protein EWE74_01115 [Sphingobacterium corticibacterium]